MTDTGEAALPPEAEIDPSDPYFREAQTFPCLSQDMADRIRPYGREETVPAGTVLWARGQRGIDFFLILEGEVEVWEDDGCGAERPFHTHGARNFSGEIDLFNNRQTIVSGRARSDSRVLRVGRKDFRRLVSGEPDIGEIILRAFILRRVGLVRHTQGGALIVGPAHDGDVLRLQRFLTRNAYPHRMFDTDGDTDGDGDGDVDGVLQASSIEPGQLPAVICPDRTILRNPTIAALADQLGLTEPFEDGKVYDVAVVGAGPAGLAAAVYAASEGLSTIVLEGLAPGGQAGTSSKIENYLGFPTGISGEALAGRAQVQAQKFGARLAVSRMASGLDCAADPLQLGLEDGRVIAARAVVVATGARYRTLGVENYDRYEGQGIHYAATAMEEQLCRGEEVVVVGGGNSAGQAAVYLSRNTAHVHILVRSEGLAATMSDYLVQRIRSSPCITVHARTEIVGLAGDGLLREVTWTDRRSGESHTRAIGNVFVMIGAEPNTEWLDGCLELDGKGFIRTGRDCSGKALDSPFETSKPGIWAVGDVRSGSVKRVASSVGEGSVVVQAIHQFLDPGVA